MAPLINETAALTPARRIHISSKIDRIRQMESMKTDLAMIPGEMSSEPESPAECQHQQTIQVASS